MNNKEVNVETVDPKIFQAIMSIVVKDSNGQYGIFFKDLCEILSLDIDAINKYLQENYSYLNSQEVIHLELPLVNKELDYHYVQGGGKYTITDADVFYISPTNMEALPHVFLDLMRLSFIKTNYNETFAVVVNITVEDCFINAHKFENNE